MTRTTLAVGTAAVLWMAAGSARADHMKIEGRTGLPTVRGGYDKIWMEKGDVQLMPDGSNLKVTQLYTLKHPGPPLVNGPWPITVGVREDYYRARDGGGPAVNAAEARGFSDFSVYVDGQPMDARIGDWKVNDKKDTATRWRTWDMQFDPNQSHELKIVSIAPLGRDLDHPMVQFVTKDVGHWRSAPGDLTIEVLNQDGTDLRPAGIEPKPAGGDGSSYRWTFHNMHPKRDIYLLLPAEPGRTAAN